LARHIHTYRKRRSVWYFSRKMLPLLSANHHPLRFSCVAGHMLYSIKRKRNYQYSISWKYQQPMTGHADVNFQRYIRYVRSLVTATVYNTRSLFALVVLVYKKSGFGGSTYLYPYPFLLLQFLSGMFYTHALAGGETSAHVTMLSYTSFSFSYIPLAGAHHVWDRMCLSRRQGKPASDPT